MLLFVYTVYAYLKKSYHLKNNKSMLPI